MGARDLSVIRHHRLTAIPSTDGSAHLQRGNHCRRRQFFEMSRNGQVFFVNNRISNLFELKAMIERHIPDCRVCIGLTDRCGACRTGEDNL